MISPLRYARSKIFSDTDFILFYFCLKYKWRQVLISLDLKEVKCIPERILRPSSGIYPPLFPPLCSPSSEMFFYLRSIPMSHCNHYTFARSWIQVSWTELMSSYVACALRICPWQSDGKEWASSLIIPGSTDFCVLQLEFSVMFFPSLETYHFSLPTIFLSTNVGRHFLKEVNQFT